MLGKYWEKKQLHEQASTLSSQKHKLLSSLDETIQTAEAWAKELKQELDANQLNPSDPRFKEYKSYLDIVNSALLKAENSRKDLTWILNKIKDLDSKLFSNKQKVVTKDEITQIIKQLQDLGKEIDDLSVAVGELKDLMNDETYNKIKNFLKQLWGDLLFEADKKLKQLDADLDKLLWRVQEVHLNNEDLKGILERAADPNNKDRTALIKQLLDEGAKDEAVLAAIKQFGNESKQYVETEKAKLWNMNPSTA